MYTVRKQIKTIYKVKSRQQAAYETILQGSIFQRTMFFILANPEGYDMEIHDSMIDLVIAGWNDRHIWRLAFDFIKRLGYDKLSYYNAGVLKDSEIPIFTNTGEER